MYFTFSRFEGELVTSSVERDMEFTLLEAPPQRELLTRGREAHRKHKRVRPLRPETEVKTRLLGAGGPRGFVLYPGLAFTRALEGVNRLLLGNTRGHRYQGNQNPHQAIHSSYNDK